MKKNLLKGVLAIAATTLSLVSFSQTDLYIGYRGNGTVSQDQLTRMDTTGGTPTIVESLTLSTDFSSDVHGLYGMALQPFTNELFVVYGIDTDDATDRRLGILDVSDATITDIANVGAVLDITFVDATLYASLGTYGDEPRGFGTINTTTGEFTQIFVHTNGTGGSAAINFDYFKNRILRSCQGSSTYEIIDPIGLTETSVSHAGHPGWTTSLLPLSDSTAYSIGNTTINVMNTNTFGFTSVTTFPSSNWLHSSSFTDYPLSVWVDGPRKSCSNNPSTLTVVGDGTDFGWYKEGIVIDGANESTYTPEESGSFYAVVDGKLLNSVEIEFVEINSNFTMSENPAYLDGAPSVDVNFFETATGTDLSYDWTSGDGEISDLEDPTFTYSAIGTYDVTLTVTDAASQCIAESTQELVIAGGVGINELENTIEVYPLPTSDIVNIRFSGNEDYQAQIIDLNGSVVGVYTVYPNQSNTIDVSDLSVGTYVIRITNGSQISERKLIKQ